MRGVKWEAKTRHLARACSIVIPAPAGKQPSYYFSDTRSALWVSSSHAGLYSAMEKAAYLAHYLPVTSLGCIRTMKGATHGARYRAGRG